MPGPASSHAFQLRRVTALIGPYGSGKTELSIGLALHGAQSVAAGASAFKQVVLADIDVLKPYFRSREANMRLRESNVSVIAPAGALANSDLPIISAELRGSVVRQELMVLLDVGGDPVGARALGSLSDVVGAADYDLLLVLNKYRPFMETVEGVVALAGQIAGAASLPITGVISNTHLLEDTTPEDVLDGLSLSREVAERLGVAVRLLGVPEHLAAEFSGREALPPVVSIRRQMKPEFLGGVVLAPARPQQPHTGSPR